MVYNTANDIKMKVFEGLGPAWIWQVIKRDTTIAARHSLDEEMDQGTSLAMGGANSAGEQVDILNPMEDIDGPTENFKTTDNSSLSKVSSDIFLPDARRRRRLVLRGSIEQSTQTRQDDIAVQEQTYDLIRNILCGAGVAEMIDFLFKEVGQEEFLDVLADNLRPRNIQLAHRREQPNRPIQVPVEILSSVSGVIIHIAAGLPRHREILVSHKDLLRSLIGHLNHSHREVRVNCVWVVINLVYEEDQSDHEGCRARATRLKELGIIEQLASLQEDSDLDVRERTKTALHLLDTLTS